MTHLYWLYHRGASVLRGVRKASSLCGLDGLAPRHVTTHRDDATCERCLALAKKDTRTGTQCRGKDSKR